MSACSCSRRSSASRCKGYENLPRAGHARHHRAQPCQPARCGRSCIRSCRAHAAFAIDTGMAQKWWVKPFLQARQRPRHRSDQAAGDAPSDPGRQGRRDAGDLPRGPPHRHGRPHEGLRRHGDDRRQGRRRSSCRCASTGPSARHFGYLNRYQAKKVWFPKTTITILPPLKLKVADALQGKARRQAAGMALQDIMVDAAVETAQHRPDAVLGARRGQGNARHGQAHRRGSARRPSSPTQADHGGAGARRQARAAGSCGRGRRRHAAELGRRGGDVLRRCRPSAACRRC